MESFYLFRKRKTSPVCNISFEHTNDSKKLKQEDTDYIEFNIRQIIRFLHITGKIWCIYSEV